MSEPSEKFQMKMGNTFYIEMPLPLKLEDVEFALEVVDMAEKHFKRQLEKEKAVVKNE